MRDRLGSRSSAACLGIVVAASAFGCRTASTPTPSPGPAAVSIVEAGSSFGFCIGPCLSTLVIDESTSPGALSFRVTDRTGSQVFVANQGRLTASGGERLSSLTRNLPDSLQTTYGCPDCADGGLAYFVVVRGGSPRRVEYEFPSPPGELAALDSFLKGVMSALGLCVATPDVTLDGSCTARSP